MGCTQAIVLNSANSKEGQSCSSPEDCKAQSTVDDDEVGETEELHCVFSQKNERDILHHQLHADRECRKLVECAGSDPVGNKCSDKFNNDDYHCYIDGSIIDQEKSHCLKNPWHRQNVMLDGNYMMFGKEEGMHNLEGVYLENYIKASKMAEKREKELRDKFHVKHQKHDEIKAVRNAWKDVVELIKDMKRVREIVKEMFNEKKKVEEYQAKFDSYEKLPKNTTEETENHTHPKNKSLVKDLLEQKAKAETREEELKIKADELTKKIKDVEVEKVKILGKTINVATADLKGTALDGFIEGLEPLEKDENFLSKLENLFDGKEEVEKEYNLLIDNPLQTKDERVMEEREKEIQGKVEKWFSDSDHFGGDWKNKHFESFKNLRGQLTRLKELKKEKKQETE